MKFLSAFEKQELIRICADKTNEELAAHFGVHYETIVRILKRLRAAGITVPERKRGRRKGKVYNKVVQLKDEEGKKIH